MSYLYIGVQQHQCPLAIATVDAQGQLHFLKQQYGHTDTLLLVVGRVSDPNAPLRAAHFHLAKHFPLLRIPGCPSTQPGDSWCSATYTLLCVLSPSSG